jgi:hypothetical protein
MNKLLKILVGAYFSVAVAGVSVLLAHELGPSFREHVIGAILR